MLKKLLLITMCLAVAILLYPLAYSQTPAPSEEQKVAGEQADTGGAKQETPAQTETQPALQEATQEPQAEIVKAGAEARTFVQGINTYVNSQVKFKLTAKDNLLADKIEYRLNDSEVQVYQEPFNLPVEGKQVITYYGVDKIGNREDAKSLRVVVDNTPPSILVTSDKPVLRSGDKVYVSKDFTFRIDARDESSGLAKVEYSLNGTDYKVYRAPFSIANEGAINLKVRAFDNVANVQEQFVMKIYDEQGKEVEVKDSVFAVQTDNVAPAVEIKADRELIQKSGRNIASNEVKYSVIATDEASGVNSIFIRIDEKGDFIPYVNPIQFNTDGEHLIEAKAVDKAGNLSNVSILSVFVDVVPPETRIETVNE
ncbi:MAG TPA: hypothetical protein PKX12_14405 [Spirochaetota bacterium]|nr:hypothetical protein [Spirochaetota bacterium]